MTQIALVQVSEKDELVGYYLIDDPSQLEGLGTFYEYDTVEQKSMTLRCGRGTRPCVNPGNEGCCCIYLGGNREIPVSCPG